MDSQGYTSPMRPSSLPRPAKAPSTLFEVDYIDDQKAYLTQSGQLYIEATAMALGKVYTFGPTFRAEKSKTRRHLTEFWMLEPEAAYADLDDMMDARRRLGQRRRAVRARQQIASNSKSLKRDTTNSKT